MALADGHAVLLMHRLNLVGARVVLGGAMMGGRNWEWAGGLGGIPAQGEG